MKRVVPYQDTVQVRTHILTVLPLLSFYAAAYIILLGAAVYALATQQDLLLQLMVNILAILAGAAFILTYVDWRLRVVTVGPHQVTVRWGWLGWHQRVVRLQSATVRLDQTLPERLVDMGTLIILPVNGEEMWLEHLGDFGAVRRTLDYPGNRQAVAWI